MNTLLLRQSINKLLREMAAIQPYDFAQPMVNFIQNATNLKSLDDINSIFGPYGIIFTNFDTYFNTIESESEKMVAPKNLLLMGGIKFALFNKYLNKINVVVEEDMFFNYLNSEQIDKKEFYKFLELILKHESIHVQQGQRMGKDRYKLDASPEINPKAYWSHQTEIMAYAQSLIETLTQAGLDYESIRLLLQNPSKINHWINRVYKTSVSPKKYNTFLKYAYQYLNMHDFKKS